MVWRKIFQNRNGVIKREKKRKEKRTRRTWHWEHDKDHH